MFPCSLDYSQKQTAQNTYYKYCRETKNCILLFSIVNNFIENTKNKSERTIVVPYRNVYTSLGHASTSSINPSQALNFRT